MERGPFFFIVGCSRSGTTLLQHMMNAHAQIAVIPETRWFVRWFEKRYGLTPDNVVTPDLVARLLQKHRLLRDVDVGIRPEELYELVGSGRQILYPNFVSYIFSRYAEVRGKPFVGNKTPGFVRSLRTMHALWPEAKFVHIIRDGRDVCLSIIEKRRKKQKRAKPGGRFATWDEDPVTTAALWWEWDVRLGQEAGVEIGPPWYYELRYEALVTEPEATCAALCEFLGVPDDDAMVRYHEGRVTSDARLAEKHPGLQMPATPGLRDWRTEMPPEDVERFEAAAGGLLDETGYPRAFPRPSPAVLEHAERLRRRFQGRPLPRRWETQGLPAHSTAG
jgi:hypothetical protein